MADEPTGFHFSRFTLIPRRRELLADGAPVKLGRRAFDLLTVLVESQGLLVTKDDLLRRVWPSTFVHENNIEVQISAIRKVLGPEHDAIQTLPGRGYRLNAAVTALSDESDLALGPAQATNVPAQMSELFGRTVETDELAGLMSARRIVTLTGAGGMGKTRLAIEVARRLSGSFPDGAWLVELAPVSDPELLPATVAAAIGLSAPDGLMSEPALATALRGKRLLLVLDNCEQLIEAVARLSEALLRAAPGLHVLTTSQERLRIDGEYVYRLPSLDCPPEGETTAEEVLGYAAVRLFVSRAQASNQRFEIDDANAAAVAVICRRLDGIPLAIELAAARTAALAVEQIASGLDHRFDLLAGGRRTALPRHQTLQALLDWSYSLLSPAEQVTLRRLSVFRGSFGIEAATEVAGGEESDPQAVDEALDGLVAKSLVIAEIGAKGARYRLLETTRSYAFGRLEAAGEVEQAQQWHAEHFGAALELGAPWTNHLAPDWLAARAPEIDDIRAAIQWAFSPAGDPAFGCALAAASTPVFTRLSLFGECARIARRALAEKDPAVLDPRSEMHLQAALAVSITPTKDQVAEKAAASNRALDLAERLGDVEHQLRGLLSLYRANCWNNAAATGYARSFHELAAARGSPADALVGQALVGSCRLRSGQAALARSALAPVIEADLRPHYDSHIFRFGMNGTIQASARLGSSLWLLGFADQAARAAEKSIVLAEEAGYPSSICHALADAACLFALLIGDHARAAPLVEQFRRRLDANALAFGRADVTFLRGYLMAAHGDLAAGITHMRHALEPEGQIWICHYAPLHLARLADFLAQAGAHDAAREAVQTAIANAEDSGDRWCGPELLRTRGEIALCSGRRDQAEADFSAALEEARRIDAPPWRLRAATSLARLWRDTGMTGAAAELLRAARAPFCEGWETADMLEADSIALELAAPACRRSSG